MTTQTRDRDIDRGWAWLVLAASYGTLVVLGTSIYMSGVLYVAFLDNFNDGPAKTSTIGSLNTGLLALLGPLASSVINSYSCRVSMLVGGVLCTLTYFVSYFLTSIDSLIIVLGIVGGLGNALACIPAVVILAYYFRKRRNLFISLSSVAGGIGMFIASPLGLFLLETYGLKGTMLIMSGLNAHICVFGMICKSSTVENSIRRKIKEGRRNQTSKAKKRNICSILKINITRLISAFSTDLLSNVPFLFFLLSTFAWSFMFTVCLMHLPNYVLGKGATFGELEILMSTFAICHTTGRFLAVLTVAKGGLDSMTLHVGMSGIIGIVTITFPFYSHLHYSEFVYAGIVGVYTGGINTLLTPITLTLVDVERISAAHGMSFCFSGSGQVIGPYLAGFLYGSTGSYYSTFIMGGVVVILGCVLGMLATVTAPSKGTDTDSLANKTIEIIVNDEPAQTKTLIDLIDVIEQGRDIADDNSDEHKDLIDER